MSEQLLSTPGAPLRIVDFSMNGQSVSASTETWTHFIRRWLLPGDVEFSSRWKPPMCSVKVINRTGGCTVASVDAAAQRLRHIEPNPSTVANQHGFVLYLVKSGSGEL